MKSRRLRAYRALLAIVAACALGLAMLSGAMPGSAQALAVRASDAAVSTSPAGAAVGRAAAPAAGTPGVPQPPTVVYTENFENNVGTAPVLLTNYTAASGETYTADPAYLSHCNGVIVEANSPDSGQSASGCPDKVSYDAVRSMAYALGLLQGAASPQTNHAVTAYTQGANPGANKIQFQTVRDIPLVTADRFLTFSVDAAEENCFANHAMFEFYLTSGGSQFPTFTTPIDPCTDPRAVTINVPAFGTVAASSVEAGTFPSNGSVLFTGSSVGIEMVNAQGSGVGNDAAFDNIRILDATPSLDKSFSPATVPQGGVSVLTFTITNTTDLAAKDGWSFTDSLPAGLLAASPAPVTDCPAGVISAPAGSRTVSVTGDLASGMTSCTVSVSVTSNTPGTYTNTPADVQVSGLNPPGPASVTFIPSVDLHVTKTASPDPYGPGEPLTYTVTVSNSGPSDADGATVADPLPTALAGSGFTWTCTATAGSTCTPSGSGNISDTVDVAAGGQLTYTITGTVPSGVQGTLVNTATVTPPPSTSDPGCDPSCAATATTDAAPQAGLSVSKSSAPNPYVPGARLTYTVTVGNAGPSDAIGAHISDPLPAALAGHGFTWTCTATAGSTCTASGSGDIIDTVTVTAGGQLTYTVTGIVPSSTTGTLVDTATVTPPTRTTEPGCSPDCIASNSNPEGPEVSMGVTKIATPSPYVPGERLTFHVIVTNGGPSDAIGAQVRDPLPAPLAGAGFTWSCAPSAGSTCTATGSGSIDDTVNVLAGGILSYAITGIVPSSAVGSLLNEATVTPPAENSDPGCTPDCAAPVTVDPQVTVAMAVTKAASPAPYVPGERLTYTVTVSNAGPSDAVGATVGDPLPAALAGSGFTWSCAPGTGASCTPSGTGDIHDTVDIPAGSDVTYTVTGITPPGLTGDLINTATVTPPADTTDPGCDPDCDASTTTSASPAAGLTVTKSALPDPYVPGKALTFTVTVANAGPSDAVGATVGDPLPAELAGHGFTWTCTATTGSSCTASGSGGITDSVTVLAGGLLVYTVRGTVPSSARATLVNTATVTPPAGVPDPGCDPDCAATVTNPPAPAVALSVVKTSSPTPYVPGGAQTFTIVVSNAGPSDADGVRVLDPQTAQLTDKTWTCAGASGGACTATGTGAIDDVADIPAGGHVTYRLTAIVKPAATGDLSNVVQATPPAGLLDPGCDPNCLGTSVEPGKALVDLTVTKSSAPRHYTAGHRLTYTVTVANGGPDAAAGVRVSDPLPAVLARGRFTWTCQASRGSSCTPAGTGSIKDIVTIAAGGRVTYTVTGTVPPGTGGPITNTVTVTPPPLSADRGCDPSCSATNRNSPAAPPAPKPPFVPVTG